LGFDGKKEKKRKKEKMAEIITVIFKDFVLFWTSFRFFFFCKTKNKNSLIDFYYDDCSLSRVGSKEKIRTE
jgi:hypothetical protein